jgi:uncharacterized glyoxalase superfamily protein PhnB
VSVQPIPTGYSTITAQLAIDGAAKAIAFYEQAFGAVVVDRAIDPSGQKIWHAAVKIGTSMIMINDVFPEMDPTAQQSVSNFWLYVEDVDASFKRAVEAGAKASLPPTDMFWGDRMAHVVDPFGQKWAIATHVKDMSPDEMKKAEDDFKAAMKKAH